MAGRFVDLSDGGRAASRDDRFSRQSIFGGRGFSGRTRRDAIWPCRRPTQAPVRHQRKSGAGDSRIAHPRCQWRLQPGDVTSFAQIITGWSIGGGKGRLAGGVPGQFYFRDDLHEPGPKCSSARPMPSPATQGEAVLADLARRPETARFIATKLVRHFIADDPPPAAVHRVARAFLKSDGDLPGVYAALIESPESWDADARKFKTPEDFVFSTLRALNVSPAQPPGSHPYLRSFGPTAIHARIPGGLAHNSKSWDGSDALMHRVLWASRVGAKYENGIEPTELAAASLGAYARPETMTALRRAASSAPGLALL